MTDHTEFCKSHGEYFGYRHEPGISPRALRISSVQPRRGFLVKRGYSPSRRIIQLGDSDVDRVSSHGVVIDVINS